MLFVLLTSAARLVGVHFGWLTIVISTVVDVDLARRENG